MQKFKFFTLAIIAMLSVNFVWGADPTITEDFEKQEKSTTYNGQVTYEASSSNAEIGWYVEHGAVSETAKLSGSQSMHMRAYYAKNSTSGTWNGALPYTNTTTAIKGLKSVSFSIAVSNTGLKYDTYYSTNGSTWTAIQTAQTLSSTGTTTKSFTIPNSDANTSYYIKIGANSGSTHANKPSSASNYTFRIDDVVFTYAAATATITKTANLTNFTYEVGSGPSAAQSFTVGGTNLTANITVTAPTNFEVSKSSGSGYASSVTLTQSSGTVSNTTIYVRMKSGLSQGTGKGGNITLSSTGATTQTIAVVGTVTAPSYTVTPQSNNTELGTVSGTTTITASPKTCVGYADLAYTVSPTGKATVNQSGNIFTVSNVTADVTVTINFAELAKDTYVDHLHNNADIERCGSYPAPSLDDAAKPTTENCDVVHYHFAGWVTDPIFTGTPGTPDDMITAGTNMTSNGRTYIAVWAKEQ